MNREQQHGCWACAQLFQKDFVKGIHLLRTAIFLRRKVQVQSQHIVGYASHIGTTQMNKTLEQQPCTDQQHNGDRDLHSQQCLAQRAVPEDTRASVR